MHIGFRCHHYITFNLSINMQQQKSWHDNINFQSCSIMIFAVKQSPLVSPQWRVTDKPSNFFFFFFTCIAWGWESISLPGNRESWVISVTALPRLATLHYSRYLSVWRSTTMDLIPKLTSSLHPGPQMTKTCSYRKGWREEGGPWWNKAGMGGCGCVL